MLGKQRGFLTRRTVIGLLGCAGVAGAVALSGTRLAETPAKADAGKVKSAVAVSENCRFDYGGEESALSEKAKRGLDLFRGKARCTRCHSNFNFSDDKFHNLGIGWDTNTVDLGRYMVTKNPEDIGAKTPTLREIARTAPYMHDGRFKTLEAVVNFYDRGGIKNPFLDNLIIPLELTEHEKKDLVAYLRSLNGEGWQQITAPKAFPKSLSAHDVRIGPPPRPVVGEGRSVPQMLVIAAGVLVSLTALGPSVKAGPTTAQETVNAAITSLDPRFDRLVPKHATLEKIADGFTWVEGPVWDKQGGYLLFSDLPANAVYKWKAGEGVSLFLKPSGYRGAAPFEGNEPGSNGLTFDYAGRLVLCQHGDRRIARLEPDGRLTALADRYDGRRINSPNDLVFTSNGDLYFTDPPFGLPKAFDDPRKETPFQGVYRLSRDGRLTLLIKDIEAPNGIAFSPDEKTLYVTDVDPKRAAWLAYDVQADGTVTNGRVFFDATRWRKDPFFGPDGLKTDKAGNLFGARPGGISVFAPDGAHLGNIETGTSVSNLAWGDDGSTLYITGGSGLYRVRLLTTGMGF
jgi:gluconolactonase